MKSLQSKQQRKHSVDVTDVYLLSLLLFWTCSTFSIVDFKHVFKHVFVCLEGGLSMRFISKLSHNIAPVLQILH